MSQKNAGEMTESYGTYMKRHFYTFLAGMVFGWITLAIGVYTTWYQQAGLAIWNFHLANPILFAVEGIGLGIISTVVYLNRPKIKKSIIDATRR
jgi:hypothetical protein